MVGIMKRDFGQNQNKSNAIKRQFDVTVSDGLQCLREIGSWSHYNNEIIFQDFAPLQYDSGNYESILDKALEMIGYDRLSR
jgi:hypothetical protein